MIQFPQTALIAIAVTATAAAGCSDSAQEAVNSSPKPKASSTVTRPASGGPTATFPDGQVIRLEVVTTPEEIRRGLMYRPSLPKDRGMLFVFAEERVPAFWMKNTLIVLDMVFLDTTGTIVDVIHDAQPCAAEPCPQYIPKRPASAVLELAGGVAGEHELVDGAQLQFKKVDGYPAE